MSPKRTRKANELPYIPLGPFQWRIPGIHYKLEYVEVFSRSDPWRYCVKFDSVSDG